jgi:hypothetical protein
LDKRQDDNLKREIGQLDSPGKQIIVQADGISIPLADNSSKLIYARNLFGSKGTFPHDSKGGYDASSPEQVGDTELIAEEWFRVAAKNGKVLIVENSTPDHTPFEEIDKAFLDAGFTRSEEDLYKRGEQILLQEDAQVVVGSMTREEVKKALDNAFTKGSYTVVYTKPE